MTYLSQEMELYFDLRNTPESSRESYLRRVKAFTKYLGDHNIDLENITTRDIQEYILYLKREKALAPGTINNYISSVRFYFTHVLGQDWDHKRIPRMKRRTKLPVIPPREDILALLNATTNLKHKSILLLIYGSGLRVSEVASLRIRNVCSKTMRVQIEEAKHDTTRYSILSDAALITLRDYYKSHLTRTDHKSQEDWLFPGLNPKEHINVKTIKNTIIKLRDRLGLDTRISAHTLRHCFATHALENGVDPIVIQQLLGHRRQSTTAIYLHVTSKSLMGIESPLDFYIGTPK